LHQKEPDPVFFIKELFPALVCANMNPGKGNKKPHQNKKPAIKTIFYRWRLVSPYEYR
jgi:hypothetical protein